jgi:quercetin dioxygenase-like cupin family protein
MPGEGNRMHYHSDWDEWWYIVKGEWDWWVEGRTLKIKQGDVVLIERDKKHKITASGEGQSIRLAVSREDVEHIYIGDGQV